METNNTSVTKIYVGKLKEGVAHVPLLFPNFGSVNKPDRLFLNQALHISQEKICEVVSTPEEAELFVLPHDYFSVFEDFEYINNFLDLAKKYSKQFVIFDYSDIDREIPIKGAVIFRTSLYSFNRKENEFSLPPVVEDLGSNYGVTYREKSDKPTVGFVGWASLLNTVEYLKYFYKNFLVTLRALAVFDSRILVKKKGIYFRKKAINSFEGREDVTTNFILRKSFSGHANDILLDPRIAREDFVRNVTNSDFTLSPKGDGNYSLRFFDTLSLGRIPVLIDTFCVLPMEEKINYDEFIVRVNYKDIEKTPGIIKSFYDGLSSEEFKAKQMKARQIFEDFLKQESFLRRVISELALKN